MSGHNHGEMAPLVKEITQASLLQHINYICFLSCEWRNQEMQYLSSTMISLLLHTVTNVSIADQVWKRNCTLWKSGRLLSSLNW